MDDLLELSDEELVLTKLDNVDLCKSDQAFPCHQCPGDESIHKVTICVEAKSIDVCGHIISIASPVFKAMIEGDFKEGKDKKIKLPGKTYKGIVLMLECIYPNSLRQVTDQNVHELLPLAEEYQVKALRQRCVERLVDQTKSTIQTETLHKLLGLALKFNIPSLKVRCIYLLSQRTLAQLSETETFYEIPENIKNKILKVTVKRYELERNDENMVRRCSSRQDLKKEIMSNCTDTCMYAYMSSKKLTESEKCLRFLQSLRLTKRFFADDKQMLAVFINANKNIVSTMKLNSAKLKPEQMPYYDETFLDEQAGNVTKVLLDIQELCFGGAAMIQKYN